MEFGTTFQTLYTPKLVTTNKKSDKEETQVKKFLNIKSRTLKLENGMADQKLTVHKIDYNHLYKTKLKQEKKVNGKIKNLRYRAAKKNFFSNYASYPFQPNKCW